MVTELDGLTRRVDRLKDLARPEPPRLEPGRPGLVARRVATLLMPDAAAKDVTVEVDVTDDGGPEALIDRERLRDLVVNLITNAIDASPAGGVVRIAVRDDLDRSAVVLSVSDEGPGIPPDERELALRPFHTTKPRGLGLGLAVAQQAAEDHGGALELGDGPRGGLLARVILRTAGAARGA
jgi:two-component system sensor histidine kinase AtoS